MRCRDGEITPGCRGSGVLAKLQHILTLTRQRASEGHLSTARQIAEMTLLLPLRGVGPAYYHMAGLWRRNLRWADKTCHMSVLEYRRALHRLNPEGYRKLSQNKIAEKAILNLFRLPTPRFVGRLREGIGLDASGRRLHSPEDLANLLEATGLEKLVFKELEGHGGKGVYIVEVLHGKPVRISPLGGSMRVSVEEFCRDTLMLQRGGDWLIEEYFVQHPILASINPTSVNTIRIWVLRHSNGESEVVTAYLRIGRAGATVDNVESGGIVAGIDRKTGTLQIAQDADMRRRLHPLHPDHGAPIEGVLLPHWIEVERVAKMALGAFPELHFAGLDIAIGPEGPVVLELNVIPGREGAGRIDGNVFRALRS